MYEVCGGEHSVGPQAEAGKVDTVDDEMNRLYAVESGLSATGMAADHRLAIKPSHIAHYAAALAQAVVTAKQHKIVVTHGTDTMLKSAQVVEDALINSGNPMVKTVVFTGATRSVTAFQLASRGPTIITPGGRDAAAFAVVRAVESCPERRAQHSDLRERV